ncbi:hypothetical protein D3C85_1805420 [compost metagenome]
MSDSEAMMRGEGISVVRRVFAGGDGIGVQCINHHDPVLQHQPSLSRNFSASSAAMQPKPAEVMAWR